MAISIRRSLTVASLAVVLLAAGAAMGEDPARHRLGSFQGVEAEWWSVQELKNQFRSGWSLRNTTDKELKFTYSIRFDCSNPDEGRTETQSETLKPGEKKSGQWAGMFGYPCKTTAPTSASMASFDLKRAVFWSKKPGATIKLSACVEAKLDAISEKFHRLTNKDLQATSGIRDVKGQAELMFADLQRGKLEKYGAERAALAQEITRAYEAIPTARRSEDGLAAVTRAIQTQVDESKFVSLHLSAGAVDLRTSNLNDAELQQLAKLIGQSGGAVQDETLSKADRRDRAAGVTGPMPREGDQHFHLNFAECVGSDDH